MGIDKKEIKKDWQNYLKKHRLNALIHLRNETNDFLKELEFVYGSRNTESYHTMIGVKPHTISRKYFLIVMEYKEKRISMIKKESVLGIPINTWRIEEIFYELDVVEHEIKILHGLFDGFLFEKYIY